MQIVNIGFLGLGRVLDYHVPAIERNLDKMRITGVYDASERRTGEVAQKLGVKGYASYEHMLADPSIDLIVVATPPTFHPAHTIQALKSGKHVIVEKPMALRAEQAVQMVEAAEQYGKFLVINHNHRYSGFANYHAIKEAIDRNAIGKPYHYDVQLMSGWGGYAGSPDYVANWECKKEHGGGSLFSWGPHLVDLVLHAQGSKPLSVFATLDSNGWEFDGDSNASLIVTFEDGAIAQIEISYVSPHAFTMFYVRGESGSINYEPHGNRLSIISGTVKTGFREEVLVPNKLPPDVIYHNLYQAIKHGEPLLIQPRDIYLVIATLEAATISAAQNRVVRLSEILS